MFNISSKVRPLRNSISVPANKAYPQGFENRRGLVCVLYAPVSHCSCPMHPLQNPSHAPPSLYRALKARQTGTISNSKFRASIYSTVVPSSTFVNVSDVPNVNFRRFTPCGRYLLAISRNSRDFVIYSVEMGGSRALHSTAERSQNPQLFQSVAHPPLVSSVTSNSVHPSMAPPLIPTQRTVQHAYAPPSHPGLLTAFPLPLPPQPLTSQRHSTNRLPTPQSSQRSPPSQPCSFLRFFTKLHQVSIPTADDLLDSDFCQITPSGRFVILASVHPRDPENPQPINRPTPAPFTVPTNTRPSHLPALSSTPVFSIFSLHLVAVETGQVVDRFTLYDDYVPLEHHAGVYMYGTILSVLSVRFQTIHILRVQETTPRFVVQAVIGSHCCSDDELVIATAHHAEASWKRKADFEKRCREVSSMPPMQPQVPIESPQSNSILPDTSQHLNSPSLDYRHSERVDSFQNGRDTDATNRGHISSESADHSRSVDSEPIPTETGFGNGKLRTGFYTGLMQRLLAYVYRCHLREGRQQRFYRVIGQYSLLLIQKTQLLDDDHLLIRLGSYERDGNPADAFCNTCFFLVYCISSTRILNLFDNKSMGLALLFDRYRDDFVGDAMVAASLPSNRGAIDLEVGMGTNGNLRRERRNKRMRSILATLPFSSQVRRPSVYLDRSLFTFTSNLLPALDGTKPLPLREVRCCKFLSAYTGDIRFKLAPAALLRTDHDESSNVQLSRMKMQFYFHPFLPLVLSLEYGVHWGTRLNIHVYGFHNRKQN